MIRLLGHVPLVRLPVEASTQVLPRGRLRAVPVDEWRSFDSSFPYSDSDYERTSPTFFEIAIDSASGDVEDIADAFINNHDKETGYLRQCHLALLLVTAGRLPLPDFSVAYLVIDGEDLPAEIPDGVQSQHLPRVGPGERELIVHGDQHHLIELDAETVREVSNVTGLLDVAGELLAPALDALRRTTRPGFTPLNEALHLVAGLEAVLVARGEPLTRTFSRRFAVLASEADGDLTEHYDLAAALYRLRSDLVHGRPLTDDDLTARDYFVRQLQRPLLCLVTIRALRWLAANPGADLDLLRRELDLCWDSPVGLEHHRVIRDQSDA